MFTECGTLAAAVVLDLSRPETEGFSLAVLGLAPSSVRVVHLGGRAHAWAWLPGSTALLLKCGGRLTQVDLCTVTSSAAQLVRPQWVPGPGEHLEGSLVCLAPLLGGTCQRAVHRRAREQGHSRDRDAHCDRLRPAEL